MDFLKSLRWAVSFLLVIGIAGCEKNIDFNLKTTAPTLVVEATIENGKAPLVVLSTSFSYFSTISAEQLANSFVHGAAVTISNGAVIDTLREYKIPVFGGYAYSYYSVDTTKPTENVQGEIGKSYSLGITVNGQTYSATTSIPALTKAIDSVWWKPAPPPNDSTRVVIMARATDPPGYGDYVRYFTKRNSEPMYPGLNSVFDDLFIDGTTYQIPITPGVNRNSSHTDDDFFFHRGDTVTLKLSNIDRATFDFWRTMEFSYASIGNPFSSPTKVLGNISNGALGYFGGYASQERTLVIPR